ncbi:MAG: 50S ribosomal protein L35 [bacterium]
MPKMKSHTSSTKRFKRLGNGKIKRTKAYKRHHAWAKSAKQIRNLRSGVVLTGANEKNISILLP